MFPPSCSFYPASLPPPATTRHHPQPTAKPVDQQTVWFTTNHQPPTANHQLKSLLLQPLDQLAFIRLLASAPPAFQSGFCFLRPRFASEKASSPLLANCPVWLCGEFFFFPQLFGARRR
ncbi:hypothetical protein J3458_021769 [Metarhizium acridum]|uniref:uncharacterized protein n=1 Tax=Metarhizium acridum TaxID=92637 RepID=UPI001C6B0B9C|nr:hypothetical protein J3458_021769 [Metarhizium acridum]